MAFFYAGQFSKLNRWSEMSDSTKATMKWLFFYAGQFSKLNCWSELSDSTKATIRSESLNMSLSEAVSTGECIYRKGRLVSALGIP